MIPAARAAMLGQAADRLDAAAAQMRYDINQLREEGKPLTEFASIEASIDWLHTDCINLMARICEERNKEIRA